jgi:syntaxin-binding protein 1
MTDQIVRTLDDEEITPADRLRLIALYVIFKNGILPADLQKLLFHMHSHKAIRPETGVAR